MKKLFIMILFFAFTFTLTAQNKEGFINPILAGFYPDPSICKVGSDYYLVNSTFAYYPGIPVSHSKDLVNWKTIGHVISRPEQMNFDSLGVSRGIFAPAIRYDKGVFYVTCTLVDGGGNFVVTSQKSEGPWSDPVWLPQVNGIDPCLFFDEDGKTYLIYNSDAPDNKPLYSGHRTIRICEFDCDKLKVISENKILINGGVDISKKPVWIEGPHIYKVNGWYYLTAAEGGTAEDHSQVIFRSDKVDGPYVPYEKNPILTQRNLDPKRKFPVTCTGHADFVQTDKGEWWTIFLGCRPYEPFEENYYNTGRETFLAPIKWIDGWPVINPDYKEVQYSYPYPIEPLSKVEFPLNGNFTIRDGFDNEQLHSSWIFLRTLREKWVSLSDKKGFLKLRLRPEKVSDPVNPSFIARRQQHSQGYASVSMLFTPENENEKAGLIIFQDENHFYYLCKSKEGNDDIIELYKSGSSIKPINMELIVSEKIGLKNSNKEILLKIETKGKAFNFYYAYNQDEWQLLKGEVDATFLSIRKAWGFVGNVYAMYATSSRKPSDNSAYFNWFEYNGKDEVYR
jgi:alpha-N-arabinofuranosidase